ncbi:hypothetical protein L0F63_003354 [Massospora cicadina]|nr:hypothetical protein L0F63_003354 [Massospora cicadina]
MERPHLAKLMIDIRRFGCQVGSLQKHPSNKDNLSYTAAASDRFPTTPTLELGKVVRPLREKVIPIHVRKRIEISSFDDMLNMGFQVHGRHELTIKISLTPHNVQLDSRSSNPTQRFHKN